MEFVADLYPSAGLLPADPVLRAKARFFVDAISTKFVPGWYDFAMRGTGTSEGLFKGVEALQSLLPAEGKYALGDEFTVADIDAAPFLGRLDLTLKNGIGAYTEEEGKKVYETLHTDPKYARYRKYLAALKARDSFKATFDEVGDI